MKDLISRFGRLSPRFFLVLIAASRVALLACVFLILHGRELSNDVQMHMGMVHHPWAILFDVDNRWDQHPPLLPLSEAVIGYPLQFFLPDFLVMRLIMIAWEVVFAGICVAISGVLEFGSFRKGCLYAALVLLPTGWMTTTVMGQDDSIAACGLLLPVLLYIRGRRNWALFMAGFGMLAAKLFVVLQVFVLAPLRSRRKILQNLLLGFSSIVLVYGWMTLQRTRLSQPLPLISFKPDVSFGTNFWIVLHNYAGLNLARFGTLTGVLALTAALVPVAMLAMLRGSEQNAFRVVAASAASVLLFFGLFYHIEPEYFTMVLPLLVLSSESVSDAAWCVAISVLPWAGKFFQNATFMTNASNTPGKYLAYRIFSGVFGSSPATWLWVDQILFSLSCVYVGFRWCGKLRRGRGGDAGELASTLCRTEL